MAQLRLALGGGTRGHGRCHPLDIAFCVLDVMCERSQPSLVNANETTLDRRQPGKLSRNGLRGNQWPSPGRRPGDTVVGVRVKTELTVGLSFRSKGAGRGPTRGDCGAHPGSLWVSNLVGRSNVRNLCRVPSPRVWDGGAGKVDRQMARDRNFPEKCFRRADLRDRRI